MRIEHMNDIQLSEMILRWRVEYEESYLYSIEHNEVQYPLNTPELEMLRDHENAVKRVQDATNAYYSFILANAEWFI